MKPLGFWGGQRRPEKILQQKACVATKTPPPGIIVPTLYSVQEAAHGGLPPLQMKAPTLRGKAKVNQETIQRLLEENDQLIRCIVEYQNKGRANECVQYQHVLHRNLIYLATIADANTSSLTKAVE